MPRNSRVWRCVEQLKRKGEGKINVYAICQAATGQSYRTGRALRRKKQ